LKPFDNTMYIAIAGLVAITFSFLLIPSDVETGKFSNANHILSFFTEFIWCVLVVFLIRILRGNKIVRKKNPDVEFELNVWGYIWRGFLIKFLAFYLVAILITLAHLKPVPSVQYTMIFTLLGYMSSVLLTWLLFSKNRKEQVRLIFSLFRGY